MLPAGFREGCRSGVRVTVNSCHLRRLVLGAAVGFRVGQVRIFIESLRASGYGGDVRCWLVPSNGGCARTCAVMAYARFRRGRPASCTDRSTPIGSRNSQSWCAPAEGRYDYVLVSDVRDVVFRRHPFEGITTRECRFYLEGAPWTFATEPVNRRWAKLLLPPADFARISTCRISCCGVVVGGIGPMTAYLERMAADLHALPLRLRREGGADTVFHNRIAYLRR